AAALVGVEEPADAAENGVGLAAHGILAAPALNREFFARRLKGHAEVPGQALNVPLVQGDQGIGAAIAGAFFTIVHRRSPRVTGNPLARIRRRGEPAPLSVTGGWPAIPAIG